MDIATLLAFAAAFFVFAASPGPDNMTIVARTLSNGAASGIAYGAGTVVGILIFLALAAFGLSIIAAKMAIVMTMLRYGGAAYLIWMGIRLWTAVPVVPDLQPVSGRRGLLATFATGVALNLGNPKMPLFYVALLPNVVGASLAPGHLGVLAMVILVVEAVVIGGASLSG
ncbi:LysE family translocator, partial [Mesorhizobium sp.]|uniref:LysE family translocator n=1 Tax=Mesorhizobium sp. TaxID=1871066 RepID=UPI0025FDF7C4